MLNAVLKMRNSTKHCVTFLVVRGTKYTRLFFAWRERSGPRPVSQLKTTDQGKALVVCEVSLLASDPHVSDPSIQKTYHFLLPMHE